MGTAELIGVKGRYMLLKLLARGGMAEIWLARKADGTDAGYVVVKRLHPYLRDEKKYRDMFLDEARITALLDHPNIVQVREVGTYKGDQFLVMEYLDGVSLGRMINAAIEQRRQVPPHLIAGIMASVCDGLDYAHNLCDQDGDPLNIIHRDVSPPNIIVLFAGEVKLVDFGVAKAESRVHKTVTGMMKGKVSYMSPEQATGKELDARSDIFSLGIVFWEVLTCRHLFKRKSEIDTLKSIVTDEAVPVRTYNQEVKSSLNSIVMRALQKDREDRFHTARHMGAAIRKYLKKAKVADIHSEIQSFFGDVLHDQVEGKHRMLEEIEESSGEPDEQLAETVRVEPPEEPFDFDWTDELDVPTQEILLEKKKSPKEENLKLEQFVLGMRIDEKDEWDVVTERWKAKEWKLEEERPITLYPKTPLKKRRPVARMMFLLLLLGLTLATGWLVRTHGLDLYSFVASLKKAWQRPVRLRFSPTISVQPPRNKKQPPEKTLQESAEPSEAVPQKPQMESGAEKNAARAVRPPHPRKPPATRYGFLQVNSAPWTEVYINDRDLGFTPVIKHRLPVGKHEVRLINDGYEINEVILVTIREGKTTNLLKKFTK